MGIIVSSKGQTFKDLRQAMREARILHGDRHARRVLRAVCGVSSQAQVYSADIPRLIDALTDFETGRAAIAYAFKESGS